MFYDANYVLLGLSFAGNMFAAGGHRSPSIRALLIEKVFRLSKQNRSIIRCNLLLWSHEIIKANSNLVPSEYL